MSAPDRLPYLEYKPTPHSMWTRGRLIEMDWWIKRPCSVIADDYGSYDDRHDEITVTLGFTYRPGSADSYFEPGDPPEVEIYEVRGEDGGLVLISDDECEEAIDFVIEHYEEPDPWDC